MSDSSKFRAIVVDKSADATGGDQTRSRLATLDVNALMPGSVTIAVDYSSINFKDGLAISGRPGVVRTWPLIAGIDAVGQVTSSADPRWKAGDRVILNGSGLGETHHGGLAEVVRVDGDSLVALPAGLSAKQAAAIGTAGFTAMLSILALERGGLTPDSGDILVTGAAGGVGSIAIALLAASGYRVHASTGRIDELGDYLHALGAVGLVERASLGETLGKPLQNERWAGAIDSVGSVTLANVLAQTNYGGTVASCGLAQGSDLPTSVLPFILRGVNLAGINSVHAPLSLREQAWARLESDLDLALLDDLTTVIGLEDSLSAAHDILAGSLHGRTVVDVIA